MLCADHYVTKHYSRTSHDHYLAIMAARYLIKCKRCSHVYPSSIDISDKGADLDKLMLKSKVRCHKCNKVSIYTASDYIIP